MMKLTSCSLISPPLKPRCLVSNLYEGLSICVPYRSVDIGGQDLFLVDKRTIIDEPKVHKATLIPCHRHNDISHEKVSSRCCC